MFEDMNYDVQIHEKDLPGDEYPHQFQPCEEGLVVPTLTDTPAA